jgi:peptidoglycan/LPS O-acetylase OafA/YrhL
VIRSRRRHGASKAGFEARLAVLGSLALVAFGMATADDVARSGNLWPFALPTIAWAVLVAFLAARWWGRGGRHAHALSVGGTAAALLGAVLWAAQVDAWIAVVAAVVGLGLAGATAAVAALRHVGAGAPGRE